jgi:hypothetical protein
MDKLKYNSYDSQKDWRKFYRACKYLNEKIGKATSGKIIDFIIYTSGAKAWGKINPKYLEKPTK